MTIPDEDVARVRAATDMVALVGEHSALRHQGRRWVGLCPFHAEKTPSFSVNAEAGLYYCFGCQASGDAISFVRATEHLDFADAVRLLADRAGVELHEDAARGADRRRRAELFDAMEQAVAFYHERLLSAADAGPARDYLRSRGYDGDVVRRFRLGWAPDDWDALSRTLRLSERVLTGTGLGFVNRRGRRQDLFRARVIFPICDPSGRPVALGGRILPVRPGASAAPEDERRPEPKYKNSPETAIYSKRRTLYALNWAKQDVIATGEVVVCEGYTDVIGFFEAGVPRAVATCGTALAEEHFTLLRNFGKRIVLAYDADSAGQSATSRVYEWERRHEVDVAVVDLPAGTDPGDLARTDPDRLRQAVLEARPFLQFRVDRILRDADLHTAEGRARAAERALEAVAEHPDNLVRDQYVMQIADRCRLEPGLVREQLGEALVRVERAARVAVGARARRGAPPAGSDGRGPAPSGTGSRGSPAASEERGAGPVVPDGPEVDDLPAGEGPWGRNGDHPGRRPERRDPSSGPGLEALRLAVHRPEAVVDRLESVLFGDEVQRKAFEVLCEAEDLHQAIEDAAPEVADLLRRVVVEDPPEGDDAGIDPVDAVVSQLVRLATRRALNALQVTARTEPSALPEIAADTARVRLWLEDLVDPTGGREAAGRLLAWLLARGQEV